LMVANCVYCMWYFIYSLSVIAMEP
jgi:hypothetical protein